jgi:3-methylcrotonyl-CoA carboxylase alpha subunit
VLRFTVAGTPDGVAVAWQGRVYRLLRPQAAMARVRQGGAEEEASLASDLPGTVVKIVVRSGDSVEQHQPLVILEAMKMEHVIEAPHAGRVREILVAEGDIVPAGRPVVRLEAT